MSDIPQNEETAPTQSDSIVISLPTVLCTDTDDPSAPETNSMVNSESKLSLPSFGSSTSPLKISSPVSLPTSPTPFSKVPLQTRANKSFDDPSQLPEQKESSSTDKPIVDTGSATGNPRNKCALQPGHSLMDWIRLGNSGKDLTGVGGNIRAVSPAELATHNTEKDAWLAIRGRVYNITHYLPYHPGGPEELLKGAGIDATELFDKVHPWVNYDSLLGKCLVGPLRIERPDAEELFNISNPSSKSDRLKEPSKAQELVRKSMENLANCITPVRKKITYKGNENVRGSPPSKIMQSLIKSSDLPVSISRKAASRSNKVPSEKPWVLQNLRFEWIQTTRKLGVFIFLGSYHNACACARYTDQTLFIDVIYDSWMKTFKLVAEGALREPFKLRIYPCTGRLEVIAFKTEVGLWKGIGEATFDEPTPVNPPRLFECKVLHVERVSHDTTLLGIMPVTGPIVTPLGYYIRVHHEDNGKEIVRSYTPLGEGWDNYQGQCIALKLAVKRYETGALSPHLTAMNVGDTLKISAPHGTFQIEEMEKVKIVYLLAAGTGITPMLSLLKFALLKSSPRCKEVHLTFFNKTEEDILFKNKLEELANEDNRFKVTHVLSNASPMWRGIRGRMCRELLLTVNEETTLFEESSLPHLVYLCGPMEFTRTGVELLKRLGLKHNEIRAFVG